MATAQAPRVSERVPASGRLESVRRAGVPLVAALAAALGATCLLNVTDLALQARELSSVDARFVGWAGAGSWLGISTALLALLVAPRMRAAVPLAVGTAVAVFGLALGHSVFDGVQLVLAFIMLGVAAGALLGGAVCLTLESTPDRRLLTVIAWAVPLLIAPAALDWLALRHPAASSIRLTAHPPVAALAAVCLVLVAWSAVTLLQEGDVSFPRDANTAEGAWTALVVSTLTPTVAVMLIGFQPEVSPQWLRPLVIAAGAVTVLGLAFACTSMPTPAVRMGFAAVCVVMLCWPPCVAALLRFAASASGLAAALVPLAIVTGVAVGAALAARRPERGVVTGLLLAALGAAGAWALPPSDVVLAAPLAVLAVGASAALVGGLRVAAVTSLGLRLVGGATVGATMLSVVFALPLDWALGGALPRSIASAGADGRVFLGLTFAAAVLAAGYAATLRRNLPSTLRANLDKRP